MQKVDSGWYPLFIGAPSDARFDATGFEPAVSAPVGPKPRSTGPRGPSAPERAFGTLEVTLPVLSF